MDEVTRELIELVKNDLQHVKDELAKLSKWVYVAVGVGIGSGAIEITKLVT